MMSGTFIRLTPWDEPSDKNPEYVWVNMARVQEMYGYTITEPGTELVMNIPNYVIKVRETPEQIMALLARAEAEGTVALKEYELENLED